MKNKEFLLFVLTMFIFIQCNEDSLSNDSVIDANRIVRNETELDQWISETITKPYGIAVEYRWNSNAAPQGSYSYPPNPEKVKAVLEAMKYLWLETYEQSNLGGEDFMKGKNPIVIRIYGGRNIDTRGVELLSNPTTTGAEMFIYNVNDFDPKNKEKVYLLMRSVHHQFAKKLAEEIPYDRDAFLAISQRKYTGSTEQIARIQYDSPLDVFKLVTNANKQGFYTRYGSISAEYDFAEMVSASLTHSPNEVVEAELNAKTPFKDYGSDPEVQERYNEEAKQSYKEFMAKQQILNEYFKDKVKINLRRLQLASIQRINRYVSQ
ncbi:MAG: putative zinc-binding metallopeptidase [Weeksellaceae bacterium]